MHLYDLALNDTLFTLRGYLPGCVERERPDRNCSPSLASGQPVTETDDGPTAVHTAQAQGDDGPTAVHTAKYKGGGDRDAAARGPRGTAAVTPW